MSWDPEDPKNIVEEVEGRLVDYVADRLHTGFVGLTWSNNMPTDAPDWHAMWVQDGTGREFELEITVSLHPREAK